MWLYARESHQTLGSFPTFDKGTKIENKEPCNHYTYWYSCTIEGYQTYIADCLIEDDCLISAYNPTELSVQVNEKVELLNICYEWALVRNQANQTGWLPLTKLCSNLKTHLCK